MSSTSICTKFRRGPNREQSLPPKIPEQKIPAVKEESAYNDDITIAEIANMGMNRAYNAVEFGGSFSQTPNILIGKPFYPIAMNGYPMVIGPGFPRAHEQSLFNGAYGHLPLTNIQGEQQLHQISIPTCEYLSYFRLPARINRIGPSPRTTPKPSPTQMQNIQNLASPMSQVQPTFALSYPASERKHSTTPAQVPMPVTFPNENGSSKGEKRKRSACIIANETSSDVTRNLIAAVNAMKVLRQINSAFVEDTLPRAVSLYLSGTATVDTLRRVISKKTELCIPAQKTLAASILPGENGVTSLSTPACLHGATNVFSSLEDIAAGSSQIHRIIFNLVSKRCGVPVEDLQIHLGADLMTDDLVITSIGDKICAEFVWRSVGLIELDFKNELAVSGLVTCTRNQGRVMQITLAFDAETVLRQLGLHARTIRLEDLLVPL